MFITGHHHAEEADLWRETGGEVEEEEAGLVVQGDSNFPERWRHQEGLCHTVGFPSIFSVVFRLYVFMIEYTG